MKNFIVAVCLLLLAVGLTVANAFAVTACIRDLSALAREGDAAALREEFTRTERFLSLTVNHRILEEALEAADEMCAYPTDGAEYRAAQAKFLSVCDSIAEGENFSFSNIF